MSDAPVSDNASPKQQDVSDGCVDFSTGRKHKHKWCWIWQDGTWTEEVYCTNCGSREKRVRFPSKEVQ